MLGGGVGGGGRCGLGGGTDEVDEGRLEVGVGDGQLRHQVATGEESSQQVLRRGGLHDQGRVRGTHGLARSDLDPADAGEGGQRRDADVGDESDGSRRDRGLDLLGRAVGDDSAAVDEDHPVGEGIGLGKVVGGEEDRLAVRSQAPHLLPEQVSRLDVQCCGRLVEEEQVGVGQQLYGDTDPFALAAAVHFLRENRGSRLIIVAPTQHLKVQWAEAAARLGLHVDPDWSPREGSLPRDMHGIVTTYQQVASSAAALRVLASDSFVIFDEIHHAGDDKSWGESVLTAFASARRRLMLSGTPFRSDTSAIPFVRYHIDEAVPDYEYGYGEALADRRVVRPVFFPRINGFMEWIAPDGETWSATFGDELDRERANQRLRTALSLEGDWIGSVLHQAHDQLMKLRKVHPDAGGLVIAMDQAHARL